MHFFVHFQNKGNQKNKKCKTNFIFTVKNNLQNFFDFWFFWLFFKKGLKSKRKLKKEMKMQKNLKYLNIRNAISQNYLNLQVEIFQVQNKRNLIAFSIILKDSKGKSNVAINTQIAPQDLVPKENPIEILFVSIIFIIS